MMIAAALLFASTIDLSAELSAAAQAAHLPAIQATVTRSRGIVAHGAAGIVELGRQDPVTNDDAFHIGSCSKPFTATIVAMLVEEKRLRWDTRILDVFPEWRTTTNAAYAPVSIADLLSHESGLQPFDDDADFVSVPPLPGSVMDRRRAFAHYVLSQPPSIPPRSGYKYSNAGFVVVAAIIERVSGRSWEWCIRNRIFRPLKMHSAGFGWPARVYGHESAADGKLTPVDPKGKYQLQDYLAPAGDLHMSTDDLCAFLRAHLRAMRGQETIISPATAAAMHTKRLRSALGFGSATVAGFDEVATYSGSADTFFTVIAIAAKQDVAVAVSTNAAGESAQKTVGAVLKDLLVRYATTVK
jgi:CubicO group peptidase (beta-lactamase class C family)